MPFDDGRRITQDCTGALGSDAPPVEEHKWNGACGNNKGNVIGGPYTVTSQERRQQFSIAFICGVCLGGLLTALGLLALG